jgi:CRISPR-associated exonuclease Cas4
MVEDPITGVLFQAYLICKRQVWLMAHKIVPDQDNKYIEIGRLIDDNSYGREKKKIHFDNMEIDVIKKEGNQLIVGEIKKTSKALGSAKLQLGFYLYQLKLNGIYAKGMILIPKEKKRIPIDLTIELEKEIIKAEESISEIIQLEAPPKLEKLKFCRKCAYEEFCWS